MKIKCPNCKIEFEVSDYEVFKRYGSKGGKKSASMLSSGERKLKAQKAIRMRWAKAKSKSVEN